MQSCCELCFVFPACIATRRERIVFWTDEVKLLLHLVLLGLCLPHTDLSSGDDQPSATAFPLQWPNVAQIHGTTVGPVS